jgi:hypothetical protein
MNDYEHRCFWEQDKIPVFEIAMSDDPDLGVKAINLVPESPYGSQYNFVKDNG